ncbi:MAG: hypothetical protein B5M48_02290 [Candidatus Omnitrophica bacterium 4484_213]|nr:MAG: hypothetical protein B5M48_02290 [Candidatus Omnitrophica bacterium 4484_213]
MFYSLLYHPDIEKESLPKIPKNIKTGIRKAIEQRLLQGPLKFGESLKRSLKGHRKLRRGYRVIYKIAYYFQNRS